MSYGWNDVQRIAEELAEAHAGVDPYSVGFVRLKEMIQDLPEFDSTSGRVGEKVLEAVQELWAKELD
ncbi:Fe-S cluster assembly protein IscX [Pseudomonas sp. TH08]|uniref:Fe-S cluster assembly protein IscX n=1 Tax=unclassified Pseudomonas TaxID=196821 RepID=UPI001912685F|nr:MULTISPECIES: Fe-S cluster assembly protein IscX [unclassified Pseudomonas]MBK5376558.1 Fe-S cluster assembly protein IscX [Pseudomonas sp. TH43]MBK5527757.1 Fe-S cluster assembly protein IscX [Pseudomonas sp. TH06]MBK5533568.1 Fe-S cluster assembly protein IscX [Pseudomonas sp. TH08]